MIFPSGIGGDANLCNSNSPRETVPNISNQGLIKIPYGVHCSCASQKLKDKIAGSKRLHTTRSSGKKAADLFAVSG